MTDTIVTTTAGPVRGTDGDHGPIFRGIPYAAPPVGALRFRAPQPVEPWEGVRDCVEFGAICPQTSLLPPGSVFDALVAVERMDEDCLFLNVWTPAADDGKRPVMVWIHGGAFTGGSGSSPLYATDTFARDGVVLVTINYRLHALGFLNLAGLFDDAEGTGNNGILDQIAALQWVRDNIAAFGGDPDNVTIFGESAGGMSVGTLLGTPAAAGLCRRAILQSGAGHSNLGLASSHKVAKRMLELLQVPAGDRAALEAAPIDLIVKFAQQIAYFETASVLVGEPEAHLMPFSPVLDTITRPERPDRVVAAGSAAGVDLLIGTCADEYRLFQFGIPMMAELLPIPNVAAYFAGHRSAEEVLKVYGADHPGATPRELAGVVATDALFVIPAVRFAEAQLPHHDRVWMYRFSWPTPVLDGALGACHALDIPFVFDNLCAPPFHGDDPPQELAREMHAAWIRFATTGDPNGGGLPAWPTYDVDRRAVLDFDTPLALLEDPGAEERELWTGVW